MQKYKVIILSFLAFCFLLSPTFVTGEKETSSKGFSLGNIFNSTLEISGGVISNFANALPTPKEIFDAPIQLIVGLPAQLIFDALNNFCSFSLHAGAIMPLKKPSNNSLGIQLLTACEVFHYKISNARGILNNPKFDRNKNVVILVPGWRTNPNDTEIVKSMSQAFFCRGGVNFLVFDATHAIDTLYFWSAYNTDGSGFELAKFLAEFTKVVPLQNIHLIGHSLGAQIMSYAAAYFKIQTGRKIQHITGLDPARPCFNEGEILSGLSRGDAQFVDVIHTNPGVLGKKEPVGDVDFYANGLSPIAPGCLNIGCSHQRAWKIYAESVYPGNEKNFMATNCNSLHKLLHARCPGEKHPMGFAVDKTLKGTFFAQTKVSPPYGNKGSDERKKTNENCGVCSENKKHKT